MTTTTDHGAVAPEVHDFLAAVRAQLADLDPDEQREILDGLEADLTDLVAERGGEALGDPVDYAQELRAAAGLVPAAAGATQRRTPAAVLVAFLDGCREQFDHLVVRAPSALRDLLTWSRPLWWVFRGWLAVELLDLFHRGDPYTAHLQLVPHLSGFGWVLLVVAILGSVAIGRGRIWPGDGSRGLAARVVLLALNLAAIGYAPFVLQLVQDGSNETYSRAFDLGYQNGLREMRDAGYGTDKAGMYVDGKWVSNIYPYDAKGRPLVGVQLFNQIGQPINVVTQPEYVDDIGNANEGRPRIYYPWTNGAAQLFNVFPVPSRVQDSEERSPTAFSEEMPPAITSYPFARVPAASLPGIKTGRQQVPVSTVTPAE